MTYKYTGKVSDVDLSDDILTWDNTDLSDFWNSLTSSTIYNVDRVSFDLSVLSQIKVELALKDFYFFSKEDYNELEVNAILGEYFVTNYLKALAKYPNIVKLFNERETLLNKFGTVTNTTTESESTLGTRVNTSKVNETPQSGNIDVSSDTYLSAISKNTADSTTDLNDYTSETTTTNNENLIKQLTTEIDYQFEGFRKILLSNCEVF